MDTMTAWVALGATVTVGLIFVAIGGAVAAATLILLAKAKGMILTFKPLWQAASLAFLAGLLIGNGLQWLWGEPSPFASAIGLPLYLVIFSRLLRRRLPGEFGMASWWSMLGLAFTATLVSCAVIFSLLMGFSILLG